MTTDLAKESVLKHFNVEFTDEWSNNADFYVYEESTADGYSVFIATHDTELYKCKRKRILL
jgi:ABC-type ATPase involved in cell division